METGHGGDGYARITALGILTGKMDIDPGFDKLSGSNVTTDARTKKANFDYTGTVQTFVAPHTGTYQMEVWGAQGGAGNGRDTQGEGGYSRGTTFLNEGDTLHIYVGGRGASDTNPTNNASNAGGFNGGGSGSSSGGGGATDIRMYNGGTPAPASNPTQGLTGIPSTDPRIIVAGGGGGGQRWNGSATGNGDDGDGGGESGVQSGSVYINPPTDLTQAQPGTQTAGGAGTVPSTGGGAGGVGVAGKGGLSQNSNVGGGGGGGGWFGGGGGGWANNQVSGGAGGSGYISPTLTDAFTQSGSFVFLSPAGTYEAGHAGHGYARISYGHTLVFRAKAYVPDDFTGLVVDHITAFGDTLHLVGTDKIGLSCIDSRNASDTARLHIEGKAGSNYACFMDFPFTISKRQLKGTWFALDRLYDGTDSVHVAFTSVAVDIDTDPSNDPEGCVYGTLAPADTTGYLIHYTYTGNDAETELTVTSYGLFNHLKDVPYNQLIFPERAKDVLKPRADMLKTAKDSLLYPLGQYGYHRKLVYAKTILTGPDAGNYLPPPAPLCNWDSLKANPLTYADTLKSRLTPIDLKGNWTAQNKVYDGTTLANFGYFPDMSLAIPGDDLNFTLDAARFKSKHAGINIVLARGMFKGYGMDVDNYSGVGDVPTENDFNSTSFRATIYPRPLFHLPEDTLAAAGVWTAYNKLYDALDTCRITYAMDSTILMKEGTTIRFPLGYSDGKTQYNTETIEKDDDVRIEIRNGKFQTFGDAFPLRGKDVGVNKAVTLTSLTGITDPKTGKLKPNPGTVTYFTRTLKDIQQNDSIVVDSLKMHIPYPSSPADSLEIALLGTDARNYTFFDYQYNFESVYDTITIASGKTVVENIITTVTDSTLIIPDTLRADITAWQLTGDWYVPDKIYDGSAKVAGEHFAPGDTLKFTPDVVAPLPGDPQPAPLAGDVVYIAGDAPPGDDWEAHFARRDVQRNPDDYAWIDSMQVFIAPLKYSGPDARNYLLPPPDTLYAKIHPRQLDGKYEAYDREYDATDSVHVELRDANIVTPENQVAPDIVNIRIWAHFEDLPRDGTLRMTIPGYWYAIVDSVKISGADAYNYDPPVYTPLDSLDAHAFNADTVKANIWKAKLNGEWAARDRPYEVGKTFAEVVFTPVNKKPGTDIEVSITGATFSDEWTATEKPISVKEEDISITGDDAEYYEVNLNFPNGFSAVIYPNTFHIAGNWNEYPKWLGYNADTGQNHGKNQTTMLPPDSTHVHIRANLFQNMDVLHRDSITVYDVQFTVNSGRTLKAMMFTLKDNATFMNSGGNIAGIDTARVVRTLPAGRNWYVSSPMDNSVIPQVAGEVLLRNAAGLPVAGKGRVEWYSDADYYWHPYHESDGVTAGFENPSEYNDELVNGLGYTAYSATEDIVTNFKGKFNEGDRLSPALSRTEGRIKSGYTLVGNPFPSYWQWTGAASGQAGALPTIWYRTRTAAGYRFWTYNASSGAQTAPGVDNVTYSLSLVPPMQAFWVRLPKGAGNIPSDYRHFTFTNAQRAHDTSADNGPNLLKSASLRSGAQPVREEVLLRVEVLDDGNPSDEAVIYADAGALSGYDRYDSDKMFNGSGGELYTFPRAATSAATTAATTADDDAFLVINGLPRIQSGDTIPVGFTSDAAGSFALRTKESAGMDSLAVDLYDRLTGDIVEDFDLGGEYVFESEIAPVTGSATETRFLLVFRERVTVDSPSGEASVIRLWVDRQNRLHVWNAAGEDLLLFNMQGALVGRWRIATSREKIETVLTPGVYVARAGSVTAKVIFYR
ncbi:MAG: hypothetical protein LBL04_15060 [Bacteroidales bacterium]|nr:hypothetical protein [Bacteroidales bacterium]